MLLFISTKIFYFITYFYFSCSLLLIIGKLQGFGYDLLTWRGTTLKKKHLISSIVQVYRNIRMRFIRYIQEWEIIILTLNWLQIHIYVCMFIVLLFGENKL